MRRSLVTLLLLTSVAGAHAQPTPPVPTPITTPITTPSIVLFGSPALPPDFTHFPYANPDAPKGGELVVEASRTSGNSGSFDSFNPFILRGTSAPEIAYVYDTLMRESADEASVSYGHLAGQVELAPDHRSIAFTLRPQAHFADGSPVTAADVAWTFDTLRKLGKPNYRQYYADVADATVESDRRIVFHFTTDQDRELPLILGQLPVLPQHWWASRDFSRGLTEAPLGSGPYRLDTFDMGRETVLARQPDWWARDLPTAKGLFNFDRIRTEYYRDSTVALQAFKAGQTDFRRENISKNWATAYDFPALQKGLVKKIAFPDHLPTGMQGWVMNTRRPVFADRRVREAMDEVFDFEFTNKNLFYGAYTRTGSYYSNSDLASSGLPGPDEQALLAPFKANLPDTVFTRPLVLPVTDGSGNNRDGLVHALRLLKAAGWEVRDRQLVNAQGQQMQFNILVDGPAYERIATPYAQWLQRLGIDVGVRSVDPAQYQHVTDDFDFDMTIGLLQQSDFPGNEQRDYFSCAAAKTPGSQNLAGVCDPAVDALVERVIAAPDPAHLKTATHALDRVLLNNWYQVPNWHLGAIWAVFWNRFGYPTTPVRSGMVMDAWWVDTTLATATDAARMGN